jgi:PAS domain S-box-containing protein
MPSLKIRLSYLILGQKGGPNRIEIIKLLNDRPYNLNQLAEILNVNYRTVKHHIDILLKNEIVSSSETGGYGEVYFLTSEMEGNMEIFEDVITKLSDYSTSPTSFEMIMEQTHDGVMMISESCDILYLNSGAKNVLGCKEGIKLESVKEIFRDDSLLDALVDKIRSGEKVSGFETVFKDLESKTVEVSLTMNSIIDENDFLLGYSLFFQDITEKKEAEKALKNSEERYALAQRAANIGSWDWDIITGDLAWSDTIESLFGFVPGDFKKTYEAFLDCVHPEDRQFVIDSVDAAVEKGEDYSIEHRIVWPDGSVHWMSETGEVFRHEDGTPYRMLGIVQDITDKKSV